MQDSSSQDRPATETAGQAPQSATAALNDESIDGALAGDENSDTTESVVFELMPDEKHGAEPRPIRSGASNKQEHTGAQVWTIVIILLACTAVLLAIAGIHYGKSGSSELDRQKLVDLEQMKQQLVRMREQNEAIQQERDSAMESARQEQQKREQEVRAAVESARREIEAMAAAAEKAEQAAKAARQAEEEANKQRIEEERLRAERKRLEQELKQAELEKQRLRKERRQAELQKKRLEIEVAHQQKLLKQGKVAREPDELFKSLEPNATNKEETDAIQQKTVNKDASFDTDPCSSPSARFLSTCN